ncbi:ImmA/IrrE family metallo-endopeptidase [Mesorhizobium sp. M1423]|uniref:ImmA/IrrE family metallo-endopeptidase n=1 Tax=Mesorhizobium sp. M1423 TaxID=2957101 RepID=UPI00333A4B2E
MLQIALDRMAVDDVATNPERIVAEIHRQLGDIAPPVPIHEIALALDIDDISEARLGRLEGMLVTETVRDIGAIVVNSSSSYERRRYSVGHELGHFLCQWHVQTQGKLFECSRQDMAQPKGDPVHVRQESEANLFAIELLAPKRFVAPYLNRYPDLEHVLSLHSKLRISKAAAARRYINLHRQRVAAVFAKDGQFQYIERGGDFPYIRLEKGQPLPTLPRAARDNPTSEMVETDAEEWPGLKRSDELSVQCLEQADGHAIVLLYLSTESGAD